MTKLLKRAFLLYGSFEMSEIKTLEGVVGMNRS